MRQEFAEHREMIAARLLRFLLLVQRTHHRMQLVHHRPPNFLLKRDSSRTKSSKRRMAAASSRSAKIKSALADAAHRNSARCARSPRSANTLVKSGIMEPRREL